ncbi:hypothetical protein Salat_2380100 [Sesamum alatum]|uniref:Uncharacterized protein n=1 Tax=Sesamum alatum TaxID=300844 RepID=A0AAE2CF08_9LAMI|nr:hypothetical protein Salat_2380100 [Sesamum alatum]
MGPGSHLRQRLKECEEDLLCWSDSLNINRRCKKEIEEELVYLNYGQISAEQKQIATWLRGELEELVACEEVKWQERSKTEWLTSGDHNMKFFHVRAPNRRRENWISGLRDAYGHRTEDKTNLKGIVHDFLSNLFSSENP